MPTELRDDILPEELVKQQARVLVKQHLNSIIEESKGAGQIAKLRSLGATKDIYEFCDLVREVMEHRHAIESRTDEAKVALIQEMPDLDQHLRAVSFSLERREPGKFSAGPPFGGDVRNLKYRVREVVDDPENPGYKKLVLGYWYDNLVRFTCWARTNKEANNLSLEFEDLMESYSWLFKAQGVSEVIYWGREADKVIDTTSTTQSTTNKYYGRPILFYVRTERLKTVSEKKLEQLIIDLTVAKT